ncbi:transcriptional regulator domain-containing protein [Gluconobacter potus]|uniref:transcriptional regulator domain-containing protein n=1 Tax=Gluconobacter potus TaxID=2724927 RepID=UPI0039E785CC
METRPDWYSPGFLDRAFTLDLPDFAQEFLSLNQDYVRGYHAFTGLSDSDEIARQRDLDAFARQWGLRFPC